MNATLYTNTRPAGMADDLRLSTNYGEVCQFITEFMQQHTFQLIETVVEWTAYEVLQHSRWYGDWIWRSVNLKRRFHCPLAACLWQSTGNGMRPILP